MIMENLPPPSNISKVSPRPTIKKNINDVVYSFLVFNPKNISLDEPRKNNDDYYRG